MKKLPSKFFFWPYAHDLQPAITELRPAFLKSVLAPWCKPNPAGDLVEFVALLCRIWNVNPWWIVVSGQREQSIFTRKDLPESVAAAWLGYVGVDVGRVQRPGYYGLFAQVERCVAQTAWYMNSLPTAAWPEHAQKDKSLRYRQGAKLKLERGGIWAMEEICEMGDWVQLEYTPHPELVLPKNFQYALERGVPAKYLEA